MTDPQSPREGDQQPEPGATKSGPLWAQVPDAEPWRPPDDQGSRSGGAWTGEPTRAVPRVNETWESATSPAAGRQGPVMENLVGSRIERARSAAVAEGWELSVRLVDPEGRNQPDGMVVAQAPRPGTPMGSGSAVAVSVVSRRSFAQRNPGALAALAALAAVLLGVLAGWAIAAAADDDDEVATEVPAGEPGELEAQVAQLTATNQQLNADLETLRAENAELTTQLAEGSGAGAELTQQVEALTGQVEALTAERDQLQGELEAAQGVIANLEASLAEIDETFTLIEDLVGTQLAAAEDYAENRQLQLVVTETATEPDSGPVDPGTIVNQAPQAGVPVAPGSVLYVEVFDEEAADAG